jgi:predicted transcriptional regulator
MGYPFFVESKRFIARREASGRNRPVWIKQVDRLFGFNPLGCRP